MGRSNFEEGGGMNVPLHLPSYTTGAVCPPDFSSIGNYGVLAICRDGLFVIELEQISVLILNHIQSTVDQIGAGLFLDIGTSPTVPLFSVCSMSFFDTGSSLSPWVVGLHAKFDQYLAEVVEITSVTPLQD